MENRNTKVVHPLYFHGVKTSADEEVQESNRDFIGLAVRIAKRKVTQEQLQKEYDYILA